MKQLLTRNWNLGITFFVNLCMHVILTARTSSRVYYNWKDGSQTLSDSLGILNIHHKITYYFNHHELVKYCCE